MSKFNLPGINNLEDDIYAPGYLERAILAPDVVEGKEVVPTDLDNIKALFENSGLITDESEYYKMISPKAKLFKDVSDGSVVTSEMMPDKKIKTNKPTLVNSMGAQALVDKIGLSSKNPVKNMDPDERVNIQKSFEMAEAEKGNVPQSFNQRTGQMEPDFWGTNTAEQDKFGTAATARFADTFDGTQPISDYTTAIRTGETAIQEFMDNETPKLTALYQAQNEMAMQFTKDFSRTLNDAGQRFSQDYNANFADKSRIDDPKRQEFVQRVLEQAQAGDYNSLTHINQMILRPAKQNMENNLPGGAGSAMILSVLLSKFNQEQARSTAPDSLDLKYLPDTPEKYDALTGEQKAGMDALEANAWMESKNSRKGVGYLFNQAGGLALSASQIATMGAVAVQQVHQTFPEWFVPMGQQEGDNYVAPGVLDILGPKELRLTRHMMGFVRENQQMIKFLLKEPSKALRDTTLPWTEITTVLQQKAKADNIQNIYDGKAYTSKEYEDYSNLANRALENTPYTIRSTTVQAHNLISGFNPDSGQQTPNSVTHLLDGPAKGFKHIKKLTLDNGQPSKLGSREKYFMKYDEYGEHKVADFADENADNQYTKNLYYANALTPGRNNGEHKQFYKNFFKARGGRFFENQDVLNSDDSNSRSLTGQGTNVTFKIDGKSLESRIHIMLMKAGIVRNMGIKVPGTELKYDKVTYAEGEVGFDNMILDLEHKYRQLVDMFVGMEKGTFNFENRTAHQQMLMDSNNPLSLMLSNFVQESADLDGSYTMDAIIEAIKFKKALDEKAPAYRSNFVTSLDGINNGLAIAALQSGFSRLLEGVGFSIYLIGDSAEIARNKGMREKSPAEAFGHPEGLVAGDGPAYYQAAEEMAFLFDASLNPEVKKLGKLLYKNGLLGTGVVKDPVMVAAFGAGEGKVVRLSIKALEDKMELNPEFAEDLKDLLMTPEEIGLKIGENAWKGITHSIGPLQELAKNKADFVRNLVEQKEKDPSLPNIAFISVTREIMRLGAVLPTASGPQYHFEGMEAFQEVTNTYNSTSPEWNKETAELATYPKATTQVAPSTIHPYDSNTLDNVIFRQLVDNPGEAHGQMGNVFLFKHDGSYGSPMYMPYGEISLNEETYKLAYQASVLDGLIEANAALGYDMNYKGSADVQDMTLIRARLEGSTQAGRDVMKYIKSINQFAGGNLTKTNTTGVGKIVVTRPERKNHNAKSAMEALGLTKANKKKIKKKAAEEQIEMPVFDNVKIKAPPKKLRLRPYNSKESKDWNAVAREAKATLDKDKNIFDTEEGLKALTGTIRNRPEKERLSFMNLASDQQSKYDNRLMDIAKFRPDETVYNKDYGLGIVIDVHATPNAQIDAERTSEVSYTVQVIGGRMGGRTMVTNQSRLERPQGRSLPGM